MGIALRKAAFFILLVIGVGAHAQTLATKVNVLYDPTFWRTELHLQPAQLQVIQQINTEFYTSIQEALEATRNPRELRDLSNELIEERSQKIWFILSHRQRLKWKKIGHGYAKKTGTWNNVSAILSIDSLIESARSSRSTRYNAADTTVFQP